MNSSSATPCPLSDEHIVSESIRLCPGYRWMRRWTPNLWESQLTSHLGRSLPAGPGSASRFRPNLLSHTCLITFPVIYYTVI